MKKWLIIIICLIVLAIAGYWIYSAYSLAEKISNPAKTISEECVKILQSSDDSYSPQKDICYREKAIIEKDETLCANVEGMISRNGCYEALSEKYLNTNFCPLINDQGARNHCYVRIAIRNKDSEFCEKIEDYIDSLGKGTHDKDTCYYKVGTIIGRTENCRVIINDKLKNNCYYNVAYVENNLGLCAEIQNPSSKEDCQNGRKPIVSIGEEAYKIEAEIGEWAGEYFLPL